MTEEEKKAINNLIDQVKFWKKNNIKNTNEEILLMLIDKQQKEIEELKTCYVIKPRELEKEINKEWQDKIKNEIKELEKMELTEGDIFFVMRDYTVLILKELLED